MIKLICVSSFIYKVVNFSLCCLDTRFEALHGGISISFCVYLNYREAEVQVLKRTLLHNSYLDCRYTVSEIMVQGRTNIGQLVSQLSLSEKYGFRENHGDFTGSSLCFD